MSQPAPHVIPYTPRPLQWRFHEERSRFCVLLCHRRFGKTVAAVNDLVRQALRVGRDDWRAAYAAPFLGQAKAVAWDYCKRFAGAVPGTRFLESELVCVLPTGGRIRLLGTENAQALRGLYLDDLVLDEPADMPRQVWTQVLRPMLADRQGRALFCGTPQGTDNLLYDVWQQAGADTQGLWSRFRFPASETGYLPQAELAAARRGMDEAEYLQEFECSFAAAVRGPITRPCSTPQNARDASAPCPTPQSFPCIPRGIWAWMTLRPSGFFRWSPQAAGASLITTRLPARGWRTTHRYWQPRPGQQERLTVPYPKAALRDAALSTARTLPRTISACASWVRAKAGGKVPPSWAYALSWLRPCRWQTA